MRNKKKGHWLHQTGKEFQFYRTSLDLMVYTDENPDVRMDFLRHIGVKALIIPDAGSLLTPLHLCFLLEEV
jgi:hypothetical protein